ncbi:MAG: hypothetical protein WCW13_00975 [archaeon]|jgi:prefoldin subunit 5
MAEEKQKKQEGFNERQLVQMAQQEEQSLMYKQNMLERIATGYRETVIAKEGLKEMTKTNGKMMINLGATILIEVEAKNIKQCKRGLADNSYKEESVEETIKWLTEKEEKLHKQMEKLSADCTQTEQRLTNVVGILKQIDAEKRNLKEQLKYAPPTISK